MKHKKMMVVISSKQNIDDLIDLIDELNGTTCREDRVEMVTNIAACEDCGCISTDVEWIPNHPEDDNESDGSMLCRICNKALNE